MSASAVRSPEFVRIAPATVLPEVGLVRETTGWNPEAFAREQIRGLVRQLFFSSAARPVKQVVFCPLDAETQIGNLCRQAGDALAVETSGSVLVVTRDPRAPEEHEIGEVQGGPTIREIPSVTRPAGSRLHSNLWLLREDEILKSSRDRERNRERQPLRPASLHSHLGDLRREFEHSILEARPATESSDAAILGQLADGIVLVLSAASTRRATARKIKERLDASGARILGTVLSDRAFPIPEAIYRRL